MAHTQLPQHFADGAILIILFPDVGLFQVLNMDLNICISPSEQFNSPLLVVWNFILAQSSDEWQTIYEHRPTPEVILLHTLTGNSTFYFLQIYWIHGVASFLKSEKQAVLSVIP